jgi:GT2 family glycosyltransferase
MNAGARTASGATLVFLHADTRIEQKAWDALTSALEDTTVSFGAFRRHFSPPSWLLSIGSCLAVWRGKIAKIFLGDQAIFVRTDYFQQSGGYREILLFEDVDLCLRLREKGKGIMLKTSITTSRRRFQAEGDFKRFYRNVVLWMKYWSGADPNELARIYYPGYYDISAPGAGRLSSGAASCALKLEAM